MDKKQLAKLIFEAVTSALKELDQGDLNLQKQLNADQLIRETDQHLEGLKALSQALYRQHTTKSSQILKAMNASLSGFVDKVTQAIRSSKV